VYISIHNVMQDNMFQEPTSFLIADLRVFLIQSNPVPLVII